MKRIFTFIVAIATIVSLKAQNNSLSFDGIDDYVDISSVGNNYGSSIITYEAWVNPTNTSGDRAIICRGNSTNNKGVSFGITNGQFWIGGNDGGQWNNSYVGNVPLNTWTHLAAVYDQTTGNIEAYINGIFMVQVNHQFDINDSDYATHIGRNQIGFIQWFSGKIDEVRIWNVARSQAEIQADMDLSICGDTAGLFAYYPLNQGIADGNNSTINIADDITPNNYDGTLYNFALNGATSNWETGAPSVIENCGGTCDVPTSLNVDRINSTTTHLNWNAVAGAQGYQIRYRVAGSAETIKRTSAGTSVTLINLTPETQYIWQIRTQCNDSSLILSNWSSRQYFTTAAEKTNDKPELQFSLNIFPNPASHAATIHFALPQSSHVRLSVYDLNEKEIATLLNAQMQPGEHAPQLNTSAFPKGVYVVKLIYDGGVESRKLIVE